MYIQNEKGSVVANCVSFFVSASKDKDTQEVKHWAVVGTLLTGRNITVSNMIRKQKHSRGNWTLSLLLLKPLRSKDLG